MTHVIPPLPINAVLADVAAALNTHGRAVIVASPGAGKTTRVPLALLDAPWRGDGRIVMLEPRRLAARAAARHMATLLGETVGETVGYRVRLDSKVGPRTRIEVVTEGVFTRMILEDAELSGVAAVIFDEFHERSLDADLGLALALDATALREDLRIAVMSATLDGARVARLLSGAPVIESPGRAFPVETRYVPFEPGQRLEPQIAAQTLEALANETGSILVFLPGQAEIRRTAALLEGRVSSDVVIAPLYGQLGPAEQDLAIRPAPPGRRKVVLATTIAETSLTIDGVRIVIDGGFARVPVYEPATGLTGLATRRVSRAGAEQRRGRAGRTAPGICIRLWAEGQTGALAPFDTPEILAADLAPLALSLASWGVGDPDRLAFLDPPPRPAWQEAIALLEDLDALDGSGRITAHGAVLARLPLHPRLAHMIALARAEGTAGTAAFLAALLSEPGLGGDEVDLAQRFAVARGERSPRADQARLLARRWAGARSDAMAAPVDLGRHAARAYPERVAQQAGEAGRFRLVNGRAARLAATDPLARSPFLVVTDVSGSAADGRIRGAVAIDRATIEEAFGDRIAQSVKLGFDAQARALRARRFATLGALRLGEHPATVEADLGSARVLAQGIARLGLHILPWSRDQITLRNRATYLFRSIGAPWPDLSDAALAETAETWLAPHVIGRTSLAAITAQDLAAALDGLLDWSRRAEIDRMLPTHFDAPSGSRLPIDFDAEDGPTLAIRVQEVFGLDRHPAIGGGRIPLKLVLLSPAHRPIQTTRDLPGFWRGSWAEVARDLKGRYPRHSWPDDPLSAVATARAKPRAR